MALSIARAIARFRRDEAGTMLAEAVIVLPMLIWAYLALFVYWDVFRSYNSVQKGAYNIADLLSRQSAVDDRFLDGMQNILEYIVDSDQEAKLRLTSVQWSEPHQRYYVLWSHSPGDTLQPWTNATIRNVANRIPAMADGHSVVIVETEVSYRPAFDVGIGDERTFSEFVVTRPRNYIRICKTSGCPV